MTMTMLELTPTRPVTIVTNGPWDQDLVSQHFDIIAINRYFAWYTDPGHTELIQRKMFSELENWRRATGKPVMVTEYGADCVAGLHMEPAMVFTEEYQVQLIKGDSPSINMMKNMVTMMTLMMTLMTRTMLELTRLRRISRRSTRPGRRVGSSESTSGTSQTS